MLRPDSGGGADFGRGGTSAVPDTQRREGMIQGYWTLCLQRNTF